MKLNRVRSATFVGALALASATASAAGIFAGLSGWQSPADGGNGDFIYIDAPVAGTAVQGAVTISGRAGNSSTDPNGGGGGGGENTFAQQPQVVIAMIDTGGNPYHADFRDETRLFHPSTYLTGFPADATAVPLCFVDGSDGAFTYRDDCNSSWRTNVTNDAPATASIEVGELVWYPGTRLLGKSFAHADASTPVGFDEGGGSSATSHGSWVSSTAVGNKFGTCPQCMLIVLEADTVDGIDAAYAWAAEQPWIDVITSSVTVGLIGVGANPGIFAGKHDGAVAASENGKIFVTSSGNGAANFGLMPTSTFLYDSGSPALIPVGASFDDGLASHWSDFPAEIMANGNSRQVADTASMTGETSVGGTSFSAPGAAGVLAHGLLEARRACGDFEEGASSRGAALTVLRANACAVGSGPFADGTLTRDELHEAFVKNAIPPYDQLSPIPGPVSWAKNSYGYVDLGHGINNGGSTIQPLVTDSILGRRQVPVRPLEQFWYDDVVREAQAQQWGPRPVVDGDGDGFPRDDGACMPDCAPAELQRYAQGFAGLGNASATYANLFAVLGVSAEEFARAAPTGFGGTYEPMPNVAGVIAETGDLTVSNDGSTLTVRLNLAGILDGAVPTVRSNPVSYEVLFKANHNGVAQDYRLSYEYQGIDLLGLLGGTISEPLVDTFTVAVDTAPNEQGTSWICPIDTDLSDSFFDIDANAAVWVIPLSAFNQSNRPVEATASCGFTRDGRALQDGDTITDLAASAVLTVGIVNFGNGLGLFGESTADDYTLGGGVTPPASVAVTINGAPAGTVVPVNGQWSLDVDFSQHAPVDGTYVIQSAFGTATDTVTLAAVRTGEALTAMMTVAPASARIGETVTFDGCESYAAHGRRIVRYTFDPDGPHRPLGAVAQDAPGAVSCSQGHDDASVYRHAYEGPGQYQATLTVTDDQGQTHSVTSSVRVAPAAPPKSGQAGAAGAVGWAWALTMLGAALARRRRIGS